MAGYICIAMLEDPPYNMILAATEEEPEEWLEELPLPRRLSYNPANNDRIVTYAKIITNR